MCITFTEVAHHDIHVYVSLWRRSVWPCWGAIAFQLGNRHYVKSDLTSKLKTYGRLMWKNTAILQKWAFTLFLIILYCWANLLLCCSTFLACFFTVCSITSHTSLHDRNNPNSQGLLLSGGSTPSLGVLGSIPKVSANRPAPNYMVMVKGLEKMITY